MTVRRKIILVFAGLAILVGLAGGVFTGFAVYYRVQRASFVFPDKETYLEAIALAEQGQAERALNVALSIQFNVHGDYSDIAMKDVIRNLVRNGQDSVVLDFAFSLDKRSGNDSPLRPGRDTPLLDLAVAQAEFGKVDEALATLKNLEVPYNEDVGKSRITDVIAERGDTDRALEVLGSIERASMRAYGMNDVALILLKTEGKTAARQLVDKALIVARSIENPRSRLYELEKVAKTLAELGDFEDAITLATALPKSDQRASGLRDIAESLARAGQMETARETVLLMSDEDDHEYGLERIMTIQLAAGDIAGALETPELRPAGPKRNKLLFSVSLGFLHKYWPEAPSVDISESSLAVANAMQTGEKQDTAFKCIAFYAAKSANIVTMLQTLTEIEDTEIRQDAIKYSYYGLLYGADFCAPIS